MEQTDAATKLMPAIFTLDKFAQADHIALYLAHDAEIDPALLCAELWARRKHVYLPCIERDEQRAPSIVHFAKYTPNTRLITNRYNIAEPDTSSPTVSIDALDALLIPLVAFTPRCERLGMGGGFYDRAIANVALLSAPYLIGLAHDCQRAKALPTDNWDATMDVVLTPTKIYTATT